MDEGPDYDLMHMYAMAMYDMDDDAEARAIVDSGIDDIFAFAEGIVAGTEKSPLAERVIVAAVSRRLGG